MGSGWENLKIQLALKGLSDNALYQCSLDAHCIDFELETKSVCE